MADIEVEMPKAPAQTFEQFVEKERERLTKAKEDALERRQKVEDELTAIDRELDGIEAYELAKQGKLDIHTKPERKPRAPRDPNAPKTERKPREAGKRNEILEIIKGEEEGYSRAELIEHLSAKGDKKREQSISNALSTLKKSGALRQDETTKRYIAV